jgi:hypothetical protein
MEGMMEDIDDDFDAESADGFEQMSNAALQIAEDYKVQLGTAREPHVSAGLSAMMVNATLEALIYEIRGLRSDIQRIADARGT